jgi:hypothetical protein
MTFARAFVRDLTDKSAAKADVPNWGTEGLSAVGIGVLAASAQVEALKKLAGQLVGDFSNAVQILLLLGAILWCAAIISGKTPASGALVVPAEAAPRRYVYTYSQFLRTLAKAGLLGTIVFVPIKLRALADDLTLLPDTLYGFVYQGANQPVDNTPLRLVSSSGEDITSGSWFTDSRGFYIVRAVRRLRRSDSIRMVPEGCKSEQSLPLARTNEISHEAVEWPPGVGASPRFIYHITCEGK